MPPAWRRAAEPAAAFVAVLALMIATEPRLAIVWDEGYTLGREARVRGWLGKLRGQSDPPQRPRYELVQLDNARAVVPPPPPTAGPFDHARLLYSWPFGREEPHGHPPFYAIVGMLGDLVAPGWEVLPRARLGPMVAFSLAAAWIYSALRARAGAWAAVAGASTWALHPHLFAHGHYATVDAILASLWVIAVLAFARASGADEPAEGRRSPDWAAAVVAGLAVGWAADTKLTGWFLPVPFLLWSLIPGPNRRRIALTWAVLLPVAALAFYAFNPPIWMAPVEGIARFLRSNLTRDKTIVIPVLFLGHVYETPRESLPWYNTLAWTLFATPVGMLAMGLVGCWRSLADRAVRGLGSLVLIHWLFLLALRALPNTPGHDGTRQILTAFGLLAILAGLGAGWLATRRWGRYLIVASLVELAVSLAAFLPVPLSYYSPAIGGLPGAYSLGLEPTYFWDSLDSEAIAWLNANTPEGRGIAFATNPTSFMYLQRTGKLPAAITPEQTPSPAWFVLQNRPGEFREGHLRLIREGHPAYVGSKFGVPLIWVYPFDEASALLRSGEGR
ncbi:MAG: glycosyltransferase family 39 protein [Isosphaeraceae bacterium]